ncbi:Pr6Pr family membrane protein [Frigoribacterium sp. CFBP 8766]|uniref:Pr6Pr family membrane protein n=1 Tax=Frigoribacterium sp. CFBP 8766 TaxID=2775273 RepID=UPI001782B0FF|nr:Pr6Pr family membrane protein [Frigoribacterium sp. CFBP 8766]MBD8585077.1 Pr6Pr family membrane protein [Frigoribacterium sp. CFBP 8766]
MRPSTTTVPALVPAALRLLAALAVVAAVVGQWVRSVESPVYQFANFFGYFTIQSNLIAAVAFVVGAVLLLRRQAAPEWSVVLRGAAATYMVTTGIVYNVLLTNVALDNSFNVQWSNDVLHKWIPLFALLDWVLVGDRGRIACRRLPVFLVYPLVWLVVVLLRGQSFVPYPFLDVERLGAGGVAVWCLVIAVVIAGLSAVVIGLSRVRVLGVDHGSTDHDGAVRGRSDRGEAQRSGS